MRRSIFLPALQIYGFGRHLFQCKVYNSTLQNDSNNKDNPQNDKTQNAFSFAIASIPHQDKIEKGGEDASFACSNILAVADGVGGWIERGVDPAKYSNALIKNLKQLWTNYQGRFLRHPKELINEAAIATKDIIGSSTLAVLTLDTSSSLAYSSYIGDSGFIIYRLIKHKQSKQLQIIYEFKDQQYYFNCPFQLGTDGTSPDQATSHTHQIEDKDIIVMGTDGLFDNMGADEIAIFIKKYIDENGVIPDVQMLSKKLAEQANENSLNRHKQSPFEIKAKEQMIDPKNRSYPHRGGKQDDITIILAQIYLVSSKHLLRV